MSAIGTLLATAAVTATALAAVKAARRRIARARADAEPKTTRCNEPFIDMQADERSGIWRMSAHEQRAE